MTVRPGCRGFEDVLCELDRVLSRLYTDPRARAATMLAPTDCCMRELGGVRVLRLGAGGAIYGDAATLTIRPDRPLARRLPQRCPSRR